MTTRQQRRAAERSARKQARKDASKQSATTPLPPPTEIGAESEAIGHPDHSPSAVRMTANRANALLSTGPRTAEGKEKSSRNSFKHGLYSKQLIVPGENPAELDALRTALFAEHRPATDTEAMLVNEMADQYWRLRRCRRFETVLLSGEFNITHMNAVQRMMTSAERGFHKALTALAKLQKSRGFVPQTDRSKGCRDGSSPDAGTTATGFVSQKPEFVRKLAHATGFVSQNTVAERTAAPNAA